MLKTATNRRLKLRPLHCLGLTFALFINFDSKLSPKGTIPVLYAICCDGELDRKLYPFIDGELTQSDNTTTVKLCTVILQICIISGLAS